MLASFRAQTLLSSWLSASSIFNSNLISAAQLPMFSCHKLLKHFGPGFMIAVGYLDPGNWSTSLAAGSQYGYSLLFIIVISNILAILLQNLSIKLGLITGLDLAQANRKHMPKYLNLLFYVLCEVAICACDLAEIIGTAIALKILFNLPIAWGVALTGLDVLILMAGSRGKGAKIFEIMVIPSNDSDYNHGAGCGRLFLYPSLHEFAFLFRYCNRISAQSVRSRRAQWTLSRYFLYNSAMGIVGATVMPHNLYRLLCRNEQFTPILSNQLENLIRILKIILLSKRGKVKPKKD